jgi:hypothetical protein
VVEHVAEEPDVLAAASANDHGESVTLRVANTAGAERRHFRDLRATRICASGFGSLRKG